MKASVSHFLSTPSEMAKNKIMRTASGHLHSALETWAYEKLACIKSTVAFYIVNKNFQSHSSTYRDRLLDPQSSIPMGVTSFLKGIAFSCKYLSVSPSGSNFLVHIGA